MIKSLTWAGMLFLGKVWLPCLGNRLLSRTGWLQYPAECVLCLTLGSVIDLLSDVRYAGNPLSASAVCHLYLSYI